MSNGTIALVQQDAAVVEELTRVLRDAGYATRAFTTLDGTYDLLVADPPDALIVGLHFPAERHGLDLVTLLKLQADTRDLPVLLTSQDTRFLAATHHRLCEQGVPAIWTITRPFQHDALLNTLRQALQR